MNKQPLRSLRERALQLLRQLRTVYRVLRHPCAPWTARLVAAITVGYVVSPIQLIPSFIPVVGQLDDAAVLWAGTWLIRRVSPQVWEMCEGNPSVPHRPEGMGRVELAV
jgi:uncharacterized membrane protein YkvA (DUF1232 family)